MKIKLTPKELRILKLTANGYFTKEIANEVSISYFTARNYKRSIFRKLDALNSPHAVAIGFSEGLIKKEDIIK